MCLWAAKVLKLEIFLFTYTDNDNQPMVEYYVDACKEFQERMATETKFERKLSV